MQYTLASPFFSPQLAAQDGESRPLPPASTPFSAGSWEITFPPWLPLPTAFHFSVPATTVLPTLNHQRALPLHPLEANRGGQPVERDPPRIPGSSSWVLDHLHEEGLPGGQSRRDKGKGDTQGLPVVLAQALSLRELGWGRQRKLLCVQRVGRDKVTGRGHSGDLAVSSFQRV